MAPKKRATLESELSTKVSRLPPDLKSYDQR
jgi:hypothetical protein